MILMITRLCIEFYATAQHMQPIEQVCFDYNQPTFYYVDTCPGEVTSPTWPSTIATCEVTLGDDD